METHLSSWQGSIHAMVERELSQKPSSGLAKYKKTIKNWLSALTMRITEICMKNKKKKENKIIIIIQEKKKIMMTSK